MAIFKGAGVAIVTPFREDGSVNFDKLGELLEEQIAGGTDCIVITGTSGEAATLSEEEHSAVIRYTAKKVNGRIPVVAGTGSNCTETAVKLSRQAEEDGADGVLLVSPYYNKTTQEGLKVHFSDIANAIHIPAILYNIPSRTGMAINPETIVWLCRNVENIVGVKEASGNISSIATLAALGREDVDIYSGDDDQVIPIMSLGGLGVISVLSNVAPRKVHDMCQAYLDGDVRKARDMQLDALPLIHALFCETNPIPVKEALNMMGKNVGGYRKPLVPMTEEHRELLRREMTNYGLLG
jgi:4-hydroxy-tetrahydrodipicolinate synthase